MIRINLLEEIEDKSGKYLINGLVLGASPILVVLIFLGYFGVLVDQIDQLNVDKEIVNGKLVKMREQTKRIDEIEAGKATLKTKLTTIASLKIKKLGTIRILDDLNTAVPEKMWLDAVKQTDSEHIEILGIALDNPTTSSFIRELKKSQYFKDPEQNQTMQITFEDSKLIKFNIVSGLKYPFNIKIRQGTEFDEVEGEVGGSSTPPAEGELKGKKRSS